MCFECELGRNGSDCHISNTTLIMDEDPDDPDVREHHFNCAVREYVIFMLLFLMVYGISFYIISKFKRDESEEYPLFDQAEATVYRISLWLCTFSFSVCLFATLLLPCSIISNEVLLYYPNSYYIKWLNHSLVHGLWNLVFLFSNISFFVFLPFTHLFVESEGLPGDPLGVKPRVKESMMSLSLLLCVVVVYVYILSAIIDRNNADLQTIFNFKSYYLPFLFSCISFLGVIMLLLCTPFGFARLFTLVSGCLVKPQFFHDLQEEYKAAQLEESSCRRRLEQAILSGKSYLNPPPMSFRPLDDSPYLQYNNGLLQTGLTEHLVELSRRTEQLDKQRKSWVIQRILVYPLSILGLVALTVITILLVLQNTVELLIGMKALPLGTMQFTLGLSSLSKLGPLGALLEVIIIVFVTVTSLVGLYTLPLVNRITPKLHQTSLDHIIYNCAVLLLFSSALPLLSRTIGITNFDLLGNYGQITWLGNFKIVLLYNIAFAVATTSSIVRKCSQKVRQELFMRFHTTFRIWTQWDDLERLSSKNSSLNKQD